MSSSFFSFDDSVTTLNGLDSWDTSGVANMTAMFNSYNSTALPDISSWSIAALTNAGTMFNNGDWSTALYDAMLIAWAAQGTIQNDVLFHAGTTTQYSAGAATTARGVLTGTYNWTITDGGQAP